MSALRRIQKWSALLRRGSTHCCRSTHPSTGSRLLRAAAHQLDAAPRPQRRAFARSACALSRAGESSGDGEEEFIEDNEVEELFQLQAPTAIGEGQHKVFIVHPDVKWGSRKQHLTTGKTTLR